MINLLNFGGLDGTRRIWTQLSDRDHEKCLKTEFFVNCVKTDISLSPSKPSSCVLQPTNNNFKGHLKIVEYSYCCYTKRVKY